MQTRNWTKLIASLWLVPVMILVLSSDALAFVHPGIPLTLADLSSLKTNINQLPWATGYTALVADGRSSTNYIEQGPFTYVNRNNAGNYDHEAAWESDMQAAYNLARMWYFTGNPNYAQKSHDVLISWANTMTNFGGIEAAFDVADYAYRYAGGADILRGTWPGWTASDTTTMQIFFAKVYWPTLAIPTPVATGSQGMEDLTAAAAIAVFNDDTNKFNQTLSAYLTDADAGLRDSYANGEMGDTGRDQGHAGLSVFDHAWTAEVFWKQGVDVFSVFDNRIQACGEYYTRYNGSSTLQTNLPFVPIGAPFWGVFNTIGGSPGSAHLNSLAANIIHAAYALRLGLQTPYVDLYGLTGWDEDGFMYYKSADSSTATPATLPALPATTSLTTGVTDADLNGCIPTGSSSYSAGTWTLQSGYSGGDPWYGGSDTIHLAYRLLTGDFTMIAEVNSVASLGSSHCKAGIMLRDSLGNASERVYVAVTPQMTYERVMYGWTALPYGSNASAESSSILQIPYWVKMERVGNRIQTYTSIDGGDWSPAGTADYGNLPSTVYVGLFGCSMVTNTLDTATFSNVRITGGDNLEALKTPPAPFAIYASPGGQIPLHWNESITATSYNVLRSTTSGGPYTAIATVTNLSYVDTNVTPGATYYYVVTASNSAGTSGYSLQDSATTRTVPATPSSPVIVSGNNSLRLTWNAASGASSYNVKRAGTSGGPYTVIGNTILTSYVDTGLANGTTYYYVVSAVNGAGESGNSAEASGVPAVVTALSINFEGGGPNGTPAVMQSSEYAGYMPVNDWNTVAGVSGTAGSLAQSDGTITGSSVSWSCNNTWSTPIADMPGDYRMMKGYLDTSSTSTTSVTVSNLPSGYTSSGYDVYVYCDGDNGGSSKTGVYTIAGTTITLVDAANVNFSGTLVLANNGTGNCIVFTNQTAGSFTLTAMGSTADGAGARGPLNSIQIVAHSGSSPLPAAPTGLSARGGNQVVNLNWMQSTSPGINGNNVYRSTSGSGGPYSLLANLTATTSYSDTAVSAGSIYFYSVTAVNGNGESAMSAYAGATTIPAAPTGLTATAGNNQVALSWAAATGASSYNVKRATVSGGPYTTLTNVTTTSYTDATAVNGATYYYVVPAVNSSGESANSSQVSATPSAPTVPNAPTNLAASASRKKVSLTWTQSTSSNITTNNVYRATVSGGPYTKVASIAATTSYTDSGLTTGTTYYFVVTALNSSGQESPYSNQVSGTAK